MHGQASRFQVWLSRALMTEMELNANSLARIEELYSHVAGNLKVEDFMADPNSTNPNDRAQAQAKFDALHGLYGTQTDLAGRSTLMSSFLALAMTDDSFRSILGGMAKPKANRNDDRTLDAIVENAGKRVVCRMATISADEATHWDALHASWETHRNNHSEAYSDGGLGCTNQAESFFSRLRRMVRGQHHFFSPKYLYYCANPAAWLKDHRRRSNSGNAFALLGGALNHPVSRVWAGY